MVFVLLFSSCKQETRIEGLWYAAYLLCDSAIPEPLHETTLLEFESNILYTIRIRDLLTGELDKVTVDTSTYELQDSVIRFEDYRAKVKVSSDSIILSFGEPKQRIVFRRVESYFNKVEFDDNCFKGSYLISGETYNDSLDFINDSVLIYTGTYSLNFPAKKWSIIDYKSFKFFNVHNELFPVTIIKSCSQEKVELYYPFKENLIFTLTPTKSKISSEDFIGEWVEFQNSGIGPPLPRGLNPQDAIYNIKIDQDSIQIIRYKRTLNFSWNLTSDGKRIYFKERTLKMMVLGKSLN